MSPRTAVVLMAYGTPRSHDQIEPYYTDIRRGRPPTAEQLADLIARYDAIGGISPLAERTEAQRDALQLALNDAAPGEYHVELGLKHAQPMIETAVRNVAELGVERVVGLVLAPHYSAFSVGQYMARLQAAGEPLGLVVRGVDSWAVEPAFVGFTAADIRRVLTTLPERTRVLFTAHSLPSRIIDAGDPYPAELRSTAVGVARHAGLRDTDWDIAWQSAGRTPEPWLGPDILAALEQIAADGSADGVLVSSVGFVADHLEVLYDLDIEAARRAADLGLAFARTACVNDDAVVMAALARRVVSVNADDASQSHVAD